MENKNIIILGINAGIGYNIAKQYSDNNYKIIGTYRNPNKKIEKLKKLKNIKLIKCDISNKNDVKKFLNNIYKFNIVWNEFFCSIGTTEPVGPFFDINFDEWEDSINVNFISQLRVLHGLFKIRDKTSTININFMAGGGTNSAFKHYSAYCVSKIALIKMCELIDAEDPSIKIHILGPGFVKTKIHLETIKAGDKAGSNLKRVQNYWKSVNEEKKFEKIFKFLQWVNKTEKKTTSGRNFSLDHDKWGSKELIQKLNKNPEMYKLRRHGNDF